ncbi:MAG: cyanophycin synthetase [Patescibacteria group bacterium]
MINLNTKKHIYIVGIKGAGVSGLAQILKGLGHNVFGSDISDKFFTDKILKKENIKIKTPFAIKNISQNIDLAISSSTYIGSNNIEIKELEKRHIPIFGYANALGNIFNQYYGIAIAGTHGKSTVSAMIAYVLEQAKLDPFALIGAELLNWKSNARIPQNITPNSIFVIEADEYKEQFLNYKPNIIVLTDIDFDHPDYYKNKNDYKKAFKKFNDNLKKDGSIIKNNKLEIRGYNLQIIGKHNQRNANLAYLTCKKLNIKDSVIKKALFLFKGTRRRLEKIGEYNGSIIIDDYAHHPIEIKASLLALKKEYPNKELVVLFHPHTFSRTKKFLKEFAKSLTAADRIYLLDIYSSAREENSNITSDNIIQNIKKNAVNLKTIKNAIKFLKKNLSSKQVLVTMGAGDVCNVAYALINHKKIRTSNKF